MTVTSKCLVQGKRIENAPTAQYTSTNIKTILDGALVTNTTGAAATLSAYIVPSGGAIGAENLVIDNKSIEAHDTYLCPELAGRRLDAGDAVHMVASDVATLSLRMDGRTVSA